MSTQSFIDEFFYDVDETLDRLIENAEALEEIKPFSQDYASEIEALTHLQESLLSHLMNLDDLMQHDKVKPYKHKELRDKVIRYSEIDDSILSNIGKTFKIDHNQLKIRKNRKESINSR
jgi:hypothetical protein